MADENACAAAVNAPSARLDFFENTLRRMKEEGRMETKPMPVPLDDVMDELTADQRAEVRKRSAEIGAEIDLAEAERIGGRLIERGQELRALSSEIRHLEDLLSKARAGEMRLGWLLNGIKPGTPIPLGGLPLPDGISERLMPGLIEAATERLAERCTEFARMVQEARDG